MSFIQNITNETLTTNGAVTNKSSLNACLDLFSIGVSADISTKEKLLEAALEEDLVTATKVVFYLRDIRNGQGNKDIARVYHKLVNKKLVQKDEFFFAYVQLLPYLPQIGSWKDVFDLYGLSDELDTHILIMASEAIYEDKLAAKWFKRQSQLHKDVAAYLGIDIGDVRRQVANFSQTVEQQMCEKKWHEITYEHVPSIANKKYAEAFKRNDMSRYQEFLDKVMNNKTTANSSILYPHEIVSMSKNNYNLSNNQTANVLWKSLPNYMTEASNILPVIDVSGSMFNRAYSNYQCIDIALGLGLYFATHNTGSYKDVWCNFSTTPNFYKLEGKTLYENLRSLDWRNWQMSTNIQAVFDKILEYSSQEDVPKAVLIVSDMEFNYSGYNRSNFKVIQDKYKAAGLEMPTLIFWRVNVAVPQQPVTQHESGSILINGYSPNIMKTICSMDLDELKSITPLNMMNKELERYKYIDTIFKG